MIYSRTDDFLLVRGKLFEKIDERHFLWYNFRGEHVVQEEPLIKTYKIVSLIGLMLWSATIFLRGTSAMDYYLARRILWVMPNFGVVWAGVGLACIIFPYIFKKEFDPKHTYPLLGAIFLLLLLSEIIHHAFFNSPFDIWDMLASAVASIIIVIIYNFKKHSKSA